MIVARTAAELAQALNGRSSAFVPTMGALHAGHAALIRHAAQFGQPVVVSVFVNPTQFAPNEDFTRYPRMLDRDGKVADEAGAQIAFAPEVEEVYPKGQVIPTPSLPPVARQPQLEDAFRPTHFAGVCQVVARLFDLVKPAAAIFGEKDFQQLRVIEAIVNDQARRWPDLKIIAHPTLREIDGLALSSRNAYLTADQRKQAIALWKALSAAQAEPTPRQAEHLMRNVLQQHGLEIDYAAVRDARTLLPIEEYSQPARALIAARLGRVRLIDNAAIGAENRS